MLASTPRVGAVGQRRRGRATPWSAATGGGWAWPPGWPARPATPGWAANRGTPACGAW